MTETEITDVIQRVAELPDRTSPDDWPEAMLVTSYELGHILRDVTAEQDAKMAALADAYNEAVKTPRAAVAMHMLAAPLRDALLAYRDRHVTEPLA